MSLNKLFLFSVTGLVALAAMYSCKQSVGLPVKSSAMDEIPAEGFKEERTMRGGNALSGIEVDGDYLSEYGLEDLAGAVMYYMDTVRRKVWLVTTVDNPEHAGVKMAYWFGDPVFSQRFYVALIDDYVLGSSRLSISYEDTIEGSTGFNLLPDDIMFLNVKGDPNLFMTPEYLQLTSGNKPDELHLKMERESKRITLRAETLDLSALNVVAPNLPRSPFGLPPNSLWVDGDVVKITHDRISPGKSDAIRIQ